MQFMWIKKFSRFQIESRLWPKSNAKHNEKREEEKQQQQKINEKMTSDENKFMGKVKSSNETFHSNKT